MNFPHKLAAGCLLVLTAPCIAAAGEPAALRANGQRSSQPRVPGYLGIVFQESAGHGVEIEMVDHDGPAGKAGLRPHDLILSVNGQAGISAEALSRMIHEASPGTALAFALLRDGQSFKLTVLLADRSVVERGVRLRVALEPGAADADPPVTEFASSAETAPVASRATSNKSFIGSVLHTTPFTGLALQTLEPQLAEFFGDAQGIGLLVQMVMPNSPAAFCGLRAGDILLRADTVAIKTSSDWGKRLRVNQGQSMQLTVLRDKREITITLTPETRHHSLLEWPQISADH